MITCAWVVKTSVNVTLNSPSQDHTPEQSYFIYCSYEVAPGFKPFAII